ncbi:MAG: LamG domain-containing protein, partial [Deltaproteobacteria bacterium]
MALFVGVFLTCVGLPDGLKAAEAGPVLWWGFDQPAESSIKDKVSGLDDSIEGDFRMMAGVAGQSLKPDGYTTCITRKSVGKSLALDSTFSVEAWVAHAAYPWNWVPVLSQNDGQKKGFSFNVGPQGNVSLGMAINGRWQECVSEEGVVPLRQWKHLAATYDSQTGIRLYVDGKPAGKLDVKGKPDWATKSPLRS